MGQGAWASGWGVVIVRPSAWSPQQAGACVLHLEAGMVSRRERGELAGPGQVDVDRSSCLGSSFPRQLGRP